jgi:hypothetical protein
MNNGYNFGFKPIDDFTFDECFAHIEQNKVDGVESDEQLIERYKVLLSQLQHKDDAMFRAATDKSTLEQYIAAHPLDKTATKYQLRHKGEARKKIAQIIKESRDKKKKATLITLSIIGVVALLVCWANYSPVKYINVEESLSITKYGDSINVTVQTDVPSQLIKMNVESGSDWLQVSGDEGEYTIVANPNPEGSRYATIKISAPNRLFGSNFSWDSKTISISQESGVPTYININCNLLSFDKFGKSISQSKFIISTDGVLDSVSSAPEWCNIAFSHLGSNRYQCVATANKNGGERRYGQITIKGGNITQSISVQQESGLASYIGFNGNSLAVSSREETKYVDVKTDGTSWSIISKPYWVESSDNGNNSLKLVIAANEGDKRSGTITIKSNNGHTSSLAINQGTSKASYIRVGQTSISAGTSGLDKYVSVSTDGKDWSVSDHPYWIDVTPSDDKIYIEVNSNSGKTREGDIILASNNGHHATISVKQDGDPTNFKAEKTSIKFGSSGDYEYVDISNNSNQSLRVEESQSWITASATSKGRIRISVPANSNAARSGYVTVRCGNESCKITVRQGGWINCAFCGGRGQVRCGYPASWMNGLHCVQEFVMNYYTGSGYYTYKSCPNCGGSGSITCSKCNGNGQIKSN